MAFVECQGRGPLDTMEPSLWRETLGRCLGSHDRCDPIGGMCHGAGCQQVTTRLHTLACPKTGWSTRTHSQVLHQAVARSLRECNLDICLEDATPFLANAQARRSPHPLRMDVTVGPSSLFRGHRRREDRHLLLDLTVVNPCAPSNLDREVTRPGVALAEAAKRKHNKYRGTFPATYTLVPLAISMCGTLGADTQALIKAMAVRRVDLTGTALTGQARAAAEGRETAHLRRRFSFVLHQALSSRTRHHLCCQGVLSMAPHGPLPAAEPDEPVDTREPGLADPGEGGLSHPPADPDGAQEQPEARAQAPGSVNGTPPSHAPAPWPPRQRRRGRRGAPAQAGTTVNGQRASHPGSRGGCGVESGGGEDTASEAGSCCSVVASTCSVYSEVASICSSEHR